jgi:hypothetical protein
MADDFTASCADMLVGTYDCVDRLVLNAYFPMGHGPGGFRVWWRRLHGGSEEELDDAHLMRLAGRFSRRVRAWAKAKGVPVIDCGRDVRKHRLAEEHLATHDVGTGVFLVLVARGPATVWEVKRTKSGVILNPAKKRAFVNHYSFHVMDPDWGHVTIKMSGHPPFGAQVILNGHEHVACGARRAGIAFTKEGNCFTAVGDPGGLAQIADTLSTAAAAGRLGQVADRWIYSACCASASTSTNRSAAASAMSTPSTRSSTAATCCSRSAARWSGCSTRWWTGPAPASTSPRCGSCSAPSSGPATGGATAHLLGPASWSRHLGTT